MAIDWNIVVSGYSMSSKERAYYKTESNCQQLRQLTRRLRGVAPAAGWLLDIRGFDLVGGIMACIVGAAGIAGWWIVGDTPWNRRTLNPLEHDSDPPDDHVPLNRSGG